MEALYPASANRLMQAQDLYNGEQPPFVNNNNDGNSATFHGQAFEHLPHYADLGEDGSQLDWEAIATIQNAQQLQLLNTQQGIQENWGSASTTLSSQTNHLSSNFTEPNIYLSSDSSIQSSSVYNGLQFLEPASTHEINIPTIYNCVEPQYFRTPDHQSLYQQASNPYCSISQNNSQTYQCLPSNAQRSKENPPSTYQPPYQMNIETGPIPNSSAVHQESTRQAAPHVSPASNEGSLPLTPNPLRSLKDISKIHDSRHSKDHKQDDYSESRMGKSTAPPNKKRCGPQTTHLEDKNMVNRLPKQTMSNPRRLEHRTDNYSDWEYRYHTEFLPLRVLGDVSSTYPSLEDCQMDLDLRRVAKALIQVDVADDTTSILMTCTREMLLNTNELSIPQLQYLVLSLDYHAVTQPTGWVELFWIFKQKAHQFFLNSRNSSHWRKLFSQCCLIETVLALTPQIDLQATLLSSFDGVPFIDPVTGIPPRLAAILADATNLMRHNEDRGNNYQLIQLYHLVQHIKLESPNLCRPTESNILWQTAVSYKESVSIYILRRGLGKYVKECTVQEHWERLRRNLDRLKLPMSGPLLRSTYPLFSVFILCINRTPEKAEKCNQIMTDLNDLAKTFPTARRIKDAIDIVGLKKDKWEESLLPLLSFPLDFTLIPIRVSREIV